MALFRRNDQSLDVLIDKLKNPATIGLDVLDDVLGQVTAHPDATPRKLQFMLTADHPKVREAGFDYLAKTAARDCADLVVEAIAASPLPRRREMAQMLWRLPRHQAMDALRRAFAAAPKGRDLRPVVLEIIGYSSSVTDFLGALKTALQQESPPALRRVAVRQVRRAAKEPAVALLLKDLAHDADEVVRSEALTALCERPTADLVETLFARLPHETKDVQRTIGEALARLARTCPDTLEEPLFRALADEDAETRATAARLLVDLPDGNAVLRRFLEFNRGLAPWLRERALDALVAIAGSFTEALGRLMADRDQDVRTAAMLLAARWKHPAIVPHVSQVWQRDADWWICSIAADILARFPTPESFATLLRREHDPDLRLSVVHAMRSFPTAEATAVLLRHLQARERAVRCTALEGLRGRAQEPVANAVFALATADPDPQVRQVAAEVLSSLGALGRPLLQQLQQQDETRAPVDTATLELEMENEALSEPRLHRE